MKNINIDQENIKKILYYNPLLGVFYWTVTKGKVKEGNQAGFSLNGYIAIKIDNVVYQAHRLAWLYMTGEWPKIIDHINNKRDDNRFSNLRSCTQSENCMNKGIQTNNTSGYKGVSFHKKSGKWAAQCKIKSKLHYLGVYKTPELAYEAYLKFAKENHGEFFKA